jgi:hypothetical protein
MVQGKNMECADIQQVNANDANEETPVPLCPWLGPTNGGVDKHQAKEQRRTPDQSVGHDFDFRGSHPFDEGFTRNSYRLLLTGATGPEISQHHEQSETAQNHDYGHIFTFKPR